MIMQLWQERTGVAPQGLSIEQVVDFFPIDYSDIAKDIAPELRVTGTALSRFAISYLNSDCKPIKPFPLGAVYAEASITGLKERADPFEVAQSIVDVLISGDAEKVARAAEMFDAGKIAEVQRFVGHHHVSRKKAFRMVQNDFGGIRNRNQEAALNVLRTLKETYRHNAVSELISGVESLFTGDVSFDKLVVRAQTGTLSDLYDNHRFMACPFFPAGEYKTASLSYLISPDVALLHFVPISRGKALDPVGVAILAFVEDVRGKRYVLVDSVEGGETLQRIRESVWKNLAYQAINSFAASIDGVEHDVLVNPRFTGASSVPVKFFNYLRSFSLEQRRVKLRLPSETGNPLYLEAFNGKAGNSFSEVTVYALGSSQIAAKFPSGFSVRPAVQRDLEQILLVEVASLPEYLRDPDSLTSAFLQNGINLACENKEGIVVGYLVSYPKDGTLHIESVAAQGEYPLAFLHLLTRFRSEAKGKGYEAVSLLARKSVGIDGLVERLGGVRLGEEQLGAGELRETYVRMEVKI
ncbi:MAG: hypothetical protein HY324_02315 [Chlamydiia bacterium]|nr:hypothetical protein [Chlamydiia bacterium]